MPQQNRQQASLFLQNINLIILSTINHLSRSECLLLNGSTHLQNNITKRNIFIFVSVSLIRFLENFLEDSRNYVQHEERLRNVIFFPHRRKGKTILSLRRN